MQISLQSCPRAVPVPVGPECLPRLRSRLPVLFRHVYPSLYGRFRTVYKKENIAEQLEKQLSSPKWNRDVINLGGITDNSRFTVKFARLAEKYRMTSNYMEEVRMKINGQKSDFAKKSSRRFVRGDDGEQLDFLL